MENQQQKAGLKARMGAGYAKFGRNGSVWRWEFTWNDTQRGQNGYDNGFLASNADIFERLKTRFVYGVLDNANYHLKANYFRVYLIDGTSKENDELIISLRFDKATDNNVTYLTPVVVYSAVALEMFSKASITYFEEVFADYALKLKGKYFPKKSVKDLIKEANAIVPTGATVNVPTQMQVAQPLTLQERYNDAVQASFTGNWAKSMMKCTPTVVGDCLVIIFPDGVTNEQITGIFSDMEGQLGQVAFLMKLAGVSAKAKEAHKTTPNGIPIGNKVQDIQSLIQIPINDKLARGGEVKSLAKMMQKKEVFSHTNETLSYVEHHRLLIKQERYEEARAYLLEYSHIFNPQP